MQFLKKLIPQTIITNTPIKKLQIKLNVKNRVPAYEKLLELFATTIFKLKFL